MADLQKTIDRCKKSISDGEPIYDYKFYYDVIELLAEKKPIEPFEEAPTVNGWISVKDRPPEANTNDEVLTTYVYDDKPGKYYVETATYWDDGEGTVQWDSVWDEYRVVGNARKTVIAWMPMPKPYKPPKEES